MHAGTRAGRQTLRSSAEGEREGGGEREGRGERERERERDIERMSEQAHMHMRVCACMSVCTHTCARKWVSNLMLYTQSTITVTSGRYTSVSVCQQCVPMHTHVHTCM